MPHNIIKPQFRLGTQYRSSFVNAKEKQFAYITDYYKKSIILQKKDGRIKFGLPYPYLVPDHVFFTEFFYWDTFFMVLGLFFLEDTKELIQGIIKNFSYEIE